MIKSRYCSCMPGKSAFNYLVVFKTLEHDLMKKKIKYNEGNRLEIVHVEIRTDYSIKTEI